MDDRVCAVVVTYNRRELLMECLEALKNQTRPLDCIYIVDNNSQDGTGRFLYEKGYLDKVPPETGEMVGEVTHYHQKIGINYTRLPENLGGAGGYYEGLKKAHQSSCQWMWLMDDDAFPDRKALEELSKYFHRDDRVALASVVQDVDHHILEDTRGYFDFNHIFPDIPKPLTPRDYQESEFVEIDFASFVGILLNKKAIDSAGFPKKEFFMIHDDVEYCIRIRRACRILLVTSSIIYHPLLTRGGSTINFLGRSIEKIPSDEFWMEYYATRNFIWIGKTYHTSKKFYGELLVNYLKTLFLILFFYDYKYKKAMVITHAYLDGLNGNFDNDKAKRYI